MKKARLEGEFSGASGIRWITMEASNPQLAKKRAWNDEAFEVRKRVKSTGPEMVSRPERPMKKPSLRRSPPTSPRHPPPNFTASQSQNGKASTTSGTMTSGTMTSGRMSSGFAAYSGTTIGFGSLTLPSEALFAPVTSPRHPSPNSTTSGKKATKKVKRNKRRGKKEPELRTEVLKKNQERRHGATKKEGGEKSRPLGPLEKETISVGISSLPDDVLATVSEMLKADCPFAEVSLLVQVVGLVINMK